MSAMENLADEFGAQLYWQESSMKYSSHIGAVVVDNVQHLKSQNFGMLRWSSRLLVAQPI